jgi:outer membrane receptor for ferrienterochelin and colicins
VSRPVRASLIVVALVTVVAAQTPPADTGTTTTSPPAAGDVMTPPEPADAGLAPAPKIGPDDGGTGRGPAKPRSPEDAESVIATPLDEVVVTGTKMATEQWEATVPTQVVDKEKIETTATIDLQDVLGEIPGIYVRRNESFGLGASTVRMQGADPNKVAILTDGRRFRGGVDGVVDLRDIPANNVERVEIIRGPASSLYGSDAMAGVINIITRQGGPVPTAEGVASWGSFDRQFYALSHGWQLGPVRYFLSGLHDEFKLFEQFGDISAQFSGENEDELQKRDQVNLRVDVDATPEHGFTFFPSFQQQTNPESKNRNWILGGEWRWDTGPGSRLTTWLNRYGFDRNNDLVGFKEKTDYVDWEGESRWAKELGPWSGFWDSHFVTLGTRARYQTLDQTSEVIETSTGAEVTPHIDQSVWAISPFLQSDVLLSEQWSLLVGSSFDVNEGYGLDVNPRATLTYRPAWWTRLSATVGRGFRAPDLRQLYGIDVNAGGFYALLGNPDLQPETDLAFQLEAQFRFRGFDGFITLFRHQFEDLIAFQLLNVCQRPGVPRGCVPDPAPFLKPGLRFQTQNFAKATTQGLELGFEVSIPQLLEIETEHDVRPGFGYAFLDTVNENGIPGEDGNELPFRPRNRVLPSLAYIHKRYGIAARIWGEYEDDAFTDVANSEDFVAKNHWLWNFKVTLFPFNWIPDGGPKELATAVGIGRHFAFFVTGENVFDQEFGPVTAGGRLAGPAAFLFGFQGKY